MTYQILKRPQALRDVEECFVYIAEENLDIGVDFLVAVENTFEELTAFPLVGRILELKNQEAPSVRIWHVKGYERYLIFYTAAENTIEIVRVLHSSRDIENLLEPLS